MTDYVEAIKPGSQEGLFSDLQGAYDKQEPWLGYMWGTETRLDLDLVRLEEPRTPMSAVHHESLRLRGRHHIDSSAS